MQKKTQQISVTIGFLKLNKTTSLTKLFLFKKIK